MRSGVGHLWCHVARHTCQVTLAASSRQSRFRWLVTATRWHTILTNHRPFYILLLHKVSVIEAVAVIRALSVHHERWLRFVFESTANGSTALKHRWFVISRTLQAFHVYNSLFLRPAGRRFRIIDRLAAANFICRLLLRLRHRRRRRRYRELSLVVQ